MEIYEIQKMVCDAGVRMFETGLVVGTWGNISVRVDDVCMVVTPSGMSYQKLKPDQMVVVNIHDLSYPGDLKPSMEAPLHAAIYRARPDVNAILHNHSTAACTVAAAHVDVPAILDDEVQIVGGPIRVAEYSLPGTTVLGQNALERLGDRNAVLLANHGAVCLGRNLEEAFVTAQVVEKSCRVFLDAQSLGGAKELLPSQVDFMRNFFLERYGQR